MQSIATDFLDDKQKQTFVALLDALLPANNDLELPSATNPVIVADILSSIQSSAVATIKSGMDRLAQQANERGSAFVDLDPPERIDLFLNDPDIYRVLASIVLQCYYRADEVVQSLGMELRPPYPEGFTVTQGDLTLLDPVRRRGQIWRETESRG